MCMGKHGTVVRCVAELLVTNDLVMKDTSNDTKRTQQKWGR